MEDSAIAGLCIWAYKQGFSDAVNCLEETEKSLNSDKMKSQFMEMIKARNEL